MWWKTIKRTAASMNMYGALTRTTVDWQPHNLVCKRFNIKPPRKSYANPNTSMLNAYYGRLPASHLFLLE